MSRSSHLPPRYPLQRKASAPHELEKQPEWLDDLLCDSDSSPLVFDCINGNRQKSVFLALSEYVIQCSPTQLTDFDSNELELESKTGKWHPGQRSRARKLQYIAELEKTVNSLQALESELAVKCSTLVQQRVALSMENSKLQQQLVRLRQQKLMMDGEYQSLRKEAERLRLGLTTSLCRKAKLHRYSGSTDIYTSEMYLQTLDWNKKLHL